MPAIFKVYITNIKELYSPRFKGLFELTVHKFMEYYDYFTFSHVNLD